MTEIIIENCVYKTHPIYTRYAISQDGYVIHITKQVPTKGFENNNGYMKLTVYQIGGSNKKSVCVHRLVWETYNGEIPPGQEIDHIDSDKKNNQLDNLQLLNHSSNCKKAVKSKHDLKARLKNRKCLKSLNLTTKKVQYYFSLTSAAKHLDINPSGVWKVCENIHKSALSKKDNCWYIFEYVDKNLPVNFIKSKNIRLRKKTDQQIKERIRKYQTQDWRCPNCDKVLQNNSKYYHRQHCN